MGQINNNRDVFNNSLADSRRFGWAPELWESAFSGPGTTYYLKDFRPVFIDTTWYACSANDCTIMHTPGIADSGVCPASPPDTRITCGTPGVFNRDLEAVSSWILSKDIVPDNAKTPSPGSSNQRAFNLVD